MPLKTKQLQMQLLQLLKQLKLCRRRRYKPNSNTAEKSGDCKLRLNTTTERKETTASGREFQSLFTHKMSDYIKWRDFIHIISSSSMVSKSMGCEIFPSVLVGWATGRASGLQKTEFDWRFARLIAAVVTTTAIIICFNKYRLIQVHLENGR